jgi:HD-GYP domain-containing protein (c-di-GMP phosphodiesterase class II)
MNEGVRSYFAIPLLNNGHISGVLELFYRSVLSPDERQLDFQETLASQVAVAIDNARLFADLEQKNTELALAYDTTLEGWSRALDLRDKETEGHTQRVTHLAVRLARVLRISETDLVHVRRGALLHDIGKMGIPDAILLKPGQLTPEEWAGMLKHPTYAYDLLAPIDYLHPALDIPYCHHERWDGTGYPRGLKGEEIPLAARIFALVDVWDALTSDRPYRPAWERERALAYIREQAGKHFDPAIVPVFLNMLNDAVLSGTK